MLPILGENNVGSNRDKYTCTFSKLIEHWRSIWYTRTNSSTDPIFHFGFVQVRLIIITLLILSLYS
jgi:hypothetical protein